MNTQRVWLGLLVGSAALCSVLLASPAGAGVDIKLDCQIAMSNPVELGWTPITGNERHDNGTALVLDEGITAGATAWGTMSGRYRSTTGNLTGFNDNLLIDFLNPAGSTTSGFEFRNIPIGDYVFSVVSGDPDYPIKPDEIQLDGATVALVGYDKNAADLAALTTEFDISVVQHASEGTGRGRITIFDTDTSNTNDGKLAGLMLVSAAEPPPAPVAEPGTFGLLVFGGLGALMRRKRKGSTMRTRARLWSALVVAGLAGLLAAPAWAGVEYKIDMDGGGGPTGTGWTSANGGNRFDNATTADLGGGARCGFKSWSNAEERDRGYDPGCGWSDEWPDVLRDFSSPKTGIFIVWNIPEGEYDVTIYFRDWQWPPTVYDAVAHDATVFSVNHSDYVCGDLDSISDTHRLSTILYDPDGGGANYDAQPSLWFDKNVSMKNGLAGYLIQEYEPPVRPVPEPAGLSLFGLGGLALIRRRRRG